VIHPRQQLETIDRSRIPEGTAVVENRRLRPEVAKKSEEVIGVVRMTQRDSKETEAKTVTGGVTSLVGETSLDVAKEHGADRNAHVLELRKKSSDRPDIQELLPESEEAKRLWSEWRRLEKIEGVLHRRRDKAGKQESDL